ncbi:cytochrome oxidase biogenesis protein, Cox20 subunit [Aspergillus heteromorphus CBS 117.55]|uniref:Cytochrome c oxidase assembly protein COX20, mitochondrial n=1 Tax=Aspergillus heteromorphus CBS 117.55 TaxID=1448321 RepID=A0A317X1Q6_9EURO|nr:cytochrome oxidase biogenesis protein, Cox20 subunit [Aspergillus heteromorphus CBS 117.55]PWY92539.1 cytochrome oxidase biogenesis protein, Cox20 subunit [Aspergillus heteromorphus CBS 117.55]
MADDTRESTVSTPEPQGSPKTNRPKHDLPQSQVGKLWDAFGNPEEPVNMLPSAGVKSGSKSKDITVTDAMKSMSFENVTSFHKAPCARDSLLLGIGAGFGVGGVRGVVGGLRSLWSASNWAVGAFAITALAAHEFCQRRRIEELDGMKQAVELMKELKVKKQREKEQKAEEVARLAEEKRKRESWTNLSNYKFW